MCKKGDLTKQHIRTTAFKLFAEYGYTKVTMQDICEKSGLSKGGLYRHYKNKFQVFTDILKGFQKERADKENAYMEQNLSAVEILNQYLEDIQQNLVKNSSNITMALYEFCIEYKSEIGEKFLSNQYQRDEKILLSLIQYGISRGEFHVTNPQGASALILFLVEGLRMASEVMPIADKTITDIFNQVREILGL